MAQNRAVLKIAKLTRKHSTRLYFIMTSSHHHIIKLVNYALYLHKMPLVMRYDKAKHISHF